MSKDFFASFAPKLHSPATIIEEIFPDDQAELANVTRALNVATSGVVRVMTVDGTLGDVFIAAGGAGPATISGLFRGMMFR